MISHKVNISCNKQFHTIILNERGQLHFVNHEDVQELEAYNNLHQLGGQCCECALFLKDWREKKFDKLPENFAGELRRRSSQRDDCRCLQKLQESKIRRGLWHPDEDLHYRHLPKVRKKDFIPAFLSALDTELRHRGHETGKIFGPGKYEKPGIYVVDGISVTLQCAFEPLSNIAMTAKMENSTVAKVVPHKNAIRGLLLCAEEIEMKLIKTRLTAFRKAQLREYLDVTESVLRAANNDEVGYLLFGLDKVSGLLLATMHIEGITGPAAQVIRNLLEPVLSKIVMVRNNALKRRREEQEHYAGKKIVQDAPETTL